jgi:YD repeat-containing protein
VSARGGGRSASSGPPAILSEGRSLYFEYTSVLGEPRINLVTGPLGLEIQYEYDAYANLVGMTRGTRVESYEYSTEQVVDRHNLTAYVDPNGNRTEYVYFPDGVLFPGEQGDEWAQGKHEFVKEVHEGAGAPEESVTAFVYDATDFSTTGELRTTVTDGRSEETEYVLNADGSPLSREAW